jgi:hypothetical protein
LVVASNQYWIFHVEFKENRKLGLGVHICAALFKFHALCVDYAHIFSGKKVEAGE